MLKLYKNYLKPKKTLTTNYGIFTINRDRAKKQSEWETFDTTPPANYELAGKILNPPGHFVYVNYDDKNKPIVYDDSRAEKFKDSSIDSKKLFAPGIEKYDELLKTYRQFSKDIFAKVGKSQEEIIAEYQEAEQKFLEENKLYKSTNYDEQRFQMQNKIVTMVLYKKKRGFNTC